MEEKVGRISSSTVSMPTPLPCKQCGHQPRMIVSANEWTVMECSWGGCDRANRHFKGRPTRREAIMRWNKANKVNGQKSVAA